MDMKIGVIKGDGIGPEIVDGGNESTGSDSEKFMGILFTIRRSF